MTAQSHTSGPWRTNGCYISSNYGEVGHAYYVSSMPDGMSEANARLMASAPDMLGALLEARDLINVIEQRSADNTWWVRADDPESAVCATFEKVLATIAKATGEAGQ